MTFRLLMTLFFLFIFLKANSKDSLFYVYNDKNKADLLNLKGEFVLQKDFDRFIPKWIPNDFFLFGKAEKFYLINDKLKIIKIFSDVDYVFFTALKDYILYSVNLSDKNLTFYDKQINPKKINLSKEYNEMIPYKDKCAFLYLKNGKYFVDIFNFDSNIFFNISLELGDNNSFQGHYLISKNKEDKLLMVVDCRDGSYIELKNIKDITYISRNEIYKVSMEPNEIYNYLIFENLKESALFGVEEVCIFEFFNKVEYLKDGKWYFFENNNLIPVDNDSQYFYVSKEFKIHIKGDIIYIKFLKNEKEVTYPKGDLKNLARIIVNNNNIFLYDFPNKTSKIFNEFGVEIYTNVFFGPTMNYVDKYSSNIFTIFDLTKDYNNFNRNESKSTKNYLLNSINSFKIIKEVK